MKRNTNDLFTFVLWYNILRIILLLLLLYYLRKTPNSSVKCGHLLFEQDYFHLQLQILKFVVLHKIRESGLIFSKQNTDVEFKVHFIFIWFQFPLKHLQAFHMLKENSWCAHVHKNCTVNLKHKTKHCVYMYFIEPNILRLFGIPS